MKKITLIIYLLLTVISYAQQQQNSELFWNNLTKLCGKSFEGKITEGGKDNDGFTGQKLTMHVMSCDENKIKIPFHVGNNHSRTWILTKNEQQILTLKHDHRHEDGSEDTVTQYGGTAPNYGNENLQYFPADIFTQQLIGYAFNNVWWLTLNEKSFTYNLAKIGSNRIFSVIFDLTNEVETPIKPW